MKKNETMTNEMVDQLVDTFQTRMENFRIKKGTKKYKELQAEFMLGATRAVDIMVGNETMTCVNPRVMISIMRGDVIEKKQKNH